jgi:transposase, IS5 family
MRKIKNEQLQFGEVDISHIEFDLRARDEIPKLLLGLQHMYCDLDLREKVFTTLEGLIPQEIDTTTGRPGMDLWKILVLGTLRVNCNWDYDKVHEMANNHRTLRLMLGHSVWEEPPYYYALHTLKDNVRLFTPEVLDQINQRVVQAGHQVVGHPEGAALKGRCDSFVVETDVHYPTDINLLFDAIRKVLLLITVVCGIAGIPGWRQSQHNIRTIKKLFRKAQKLKRSNAKDPKKQAARAQIIKDAHQAYLDLVTSFLDKVKQTLILLRDGQLASEDQLNIIEAYISHAERQIDQIRRRVLKGEKIPHKEKVFSIFEEHTEWICKGKAGVPQELGLRVCILEDQYGFVLYHVVMQDQGDEAVAIPMVTETQTRFSTLSSCSFDKGFYTPEVRKKLEELLETLILPKKGKLSEADRARQASEEFVQGRTQHSAVESGINALENHGLDRCTDHGLCGFQRYTALAVVARNLQILGHLLQQNALKRQRRIENRLKTRAKNAWEVHCRLS